MGLLLNIVNSLIGYNDAKGASSNPLQRAYDWERRYQAIPAKNATSDFVTIEPGEEFVLFDGTRNLPTPLLAATSEMSLLRLQSSKSLYRLRITTGPGAFRTERVTSFSAASVMTLTVNNNAILDLTLPDLLNGTLANVQVGDIVRIRGAQTSDPTGNSFSSANSGYWTVIASSAQKISMRRAPGTTFQGVNETVTLGATDTLDQIRIYSNQGVQKGDSFILAGSFSPASFNNYEVAEVGPDFIDFVSGQPLPEEQNILLSSDDDLIFYYNAKKLVYIECDQSICIRYNLDTSNNNVVKPISVGNECLPGFSNKWGFTWKCVVKNNSQLSTCNIKWIAAE